MIPAVVEGKLARATPGAHGVCPECRDPVYARIPDSAIRHWAHIPLPDGQERACSRGSKMTEWHYSWQTRCADLERIEVRSGEHRADIVNASGHAIEFQHSPISEADIRSRETHWRRGVWVLDGTGETDDGQPKVQLRRRPDQAAEDPWRLFVWRRCPLLLWRARWPCWIDLGDRGLLQVAQIRDDRPPAGNGWLAGWEWFTDQVINGGQLTLRSHVARTEPAGKPHTKPRQARAEDRRDLVVTPGVCTRAGDDRWPVDDYGTCCRDLESPLMPACQLCPASPTHWRNTPGYQQRHPTTTVGGS